MTNAAREFEENGYILLKGFYDVAEDIAPIQETARQIIAHVATQHGVAAPHATWEEASTVGLMALATHDRRLGALVYDAVKHIPALGRLVYKRRNEELLATLRDGLLPGVAYDGYGIRLDFPHEEKFRAYWHQEFPAQQRSLDGVVFWTPLVPILDDMGPVQVAPRSHREGPIATVEDSGGVGRTGAYSMRLPDEEALVGKYDIIAPLTEPGDLLVMDYLTLHQSGYNVSDRARWSVQFRLFNYNNATAVKTGWQRTAAPTAGLFEIARADYMGREGTD